MSANNIVSLKDVKNGKSAINFITGLFKEVYLVGGAVRDEILNRSTVDLDFAVPDSPDDIKRILENEGLVVRTQAERFGTISTLIGRYDVQITTYRTESYQEESRYPNIVHIRDIDSDLARRDFTINSIAISRTELIDPYDGVSDIEKKTIKAVGDPGVRFSEDPLRILRAFRFVSQLGFDIEPATLRAAQLNNKRLRLVSGARIGAEISKLLNGSYWADAIYEAIDSGVIVNCLHIADFGYDVPTTIVDAEFSQYTQSELNSMTVIDRWTLLFSIILDSELSAIGSSIEPNVTINNIGRAFELGNKLVDKIIARIEDSYILKANKMSVYNYEDKIRRYTDEYDLLSNLGDDRQYIALSNLKFEQGKEQINNKKYRQAKNSFLASIKATDKSFQLATVNVGEYQRALRAGRVKFHFSERYIYYIAACVLEQNLHIKISALKDFLTTIKKETHIVKLFFQLSDTDIKRCIEEAIVTVFRLYGRDLAIGPLEKFLARKDLNLEPDRLTYLRNKNYFRIIHSQDLSSVEKSKYYRKIADEVAANASDEISLKFEYYDPLIDSLVWKCMSTASETDFWVCYHELQTVTDNYIEMALKNGRGSKGFRSAYLNSAFVLIHCLTIAVDLSSKVEISRAIVIDYKMAGYGYEKNANRFDIYLEWFSFVEKITNLEYDETTLVQLLGFLSTTKAKNYVDPDEVFFSSQLSDIAKTRDNLQGMALVLDRIVAQVNLEEEFGLKTKQPELNSIWILFSQSLLTSHEVFIILRNFSFKHSALSSSGLSVGFGELINQKSENIILIENGESDVIEFKASWRYNKFTKENDAKDAIAIGILKTVSAFMNTSGGKLFLGVEDDGTVTGLEVTDFNVLKHTSISKKIDAIKLQIDDLVDTTIGSDKGTLLDISTESYNGVTILVIDVSKSTSPVFFDDSFYVRVSASTRVVVADKMLAYIKDRFT